MFTRAAGAALAVASMLALMSPMSARAGTVVFGNLGATGTSAISTTNTDLGSLKPDDTNWIAQGFNTGTSALLSVDAVTVGVFGGDPSPIPLTVSIYSSNGLGNPDTALFTSSATSVGSGDKYRFTFSGASLSPNTNYFVVPNGGSWYWAAGNALAATPRQQNDSGYTFTKTVESNALTTSPAGPWIDPAGSNRYSVSIEAVAVPEPSTLMLACVGIAGGIAIQQNRRHRRRLPAAAATQDDTSAIELG